VAGKFFFLDFAIFSKSKNRKIKKIKKTNIFGVKILSSIHEVEQANVSLGRSKLAVGGRDQQLIGRIISPSVMRPPQ
jgi:hypothetical protein